MTRGVPQSAVNLVKTSEGFCASRSPDPVGLPTIGYGHKLKFTDPYWNATLSEESAEALALDDLDNVAEQLWTVLGGPTIQDFTEGQWAALLDFTFNLGIGTFEGSTLCALIKAGDLEGATHQFGRWVYGDVNGQPVKLGGLVIRRAAETALWQS